MIHHGIKLSEAIQGLGHKNPSSLARELTGEAPPVLEYRRVYQKLLALQKEEFIPDKDWAYLENLHPSLSKETVLASPDPDGEKKPIDSIQESDTYLKLLRRQAAVESEFRQTQSEMMKKILDLTQKIDETVSELMEDKQKDEDDE